MRLFHKIALGLVAAAAAPIATVGFAVISANQRALEGAVRARFDQTARHAAEAVAAGVEGRARQLAQTASVIRWADLSEDEARGALELLRRQAKAQAAELHDGTGAVRAQAGDGQVLKDHAPRERADREGPGAIVFAAPYRAALGPMLAAAMAVRGGVVSLAIPLAGEASRLDEVRGGERDLALFLVDDRGEVIARAGDEEQPTPAVLQDAVAGKDGHARRFVARDGEVVVGAFAPVGGLGWAVIVEEPAARAFAGPRRMQRLTLAITAGAAVLALLLAAVFARQLTAALERLARAARAFGAGDLAARVPERSSSDEVAELAATFNRMGDQLAASRAEIEGWNRELEARVEARTRELKEAQAQLVQAQKLAALGQLGAGVAHEINNPLGGVIGHVQLLLANRDAADEDYEALRCIDEAARNASQVVQNLLRFSVQHKEPVHTRVDLNRLVRDTLSLTSTLLEEQRISLELDLDAASPRARGDAGQLGQVLINLVSNARTAMPGGGRLKVRTRGDGDTVQLAVEDSGRGIDPAIRDRIFEPFFTTKDEWSNVGLGLSVSYRIVADHGGRLDVASRVGEGSTFTVTLPAS